MSRQFILEAWKEVPFSSLDIRRNDIYLHMGQGRYVPDDYVRESVERILAEVAKLCRPRFGYRLFEGPVGELFNCGEVISSVFVKADKFAIFVATSGAEFQQYMEGSARSGDIMEEFMVNSIGSEIAEAVGRAAAQSLAADCASLGFNIGNSYSPGYCGWSVAEQRMLFSMLPQTPCGITLNDSCLMTPIKSVSGIIPVGAEVIKEKYRCAYCTRTDCYKKRKRK